MVRTCIVTIVLVLATGTLALAQTLPRQPPPPRMSSMPGTRQERNACGSDVMRFCRKLVPPDPNAPVDAFAVASCLQAHRARISRACKLVLSGHGR